MTALDLTDLAPRRILSASLPHERYGALADTCDSASALSYRPGATAAPHGGAHRARLLIYGANGLLTGLFVAIECLICMLLLCVEPAYAYVDPSVMTYTIQALAGVAVALSALAGVVFRRTRKWLFSKLNIDENAHKHVDGAVRRIAPHQAAQADARFVERRAQEKATQQRNVLSWGKRLVIALLVNAALFLFLVVFNPYDIYFGNVKDLDLLFSEFWWIFAIGFAVLTVVCTAIVSALRGRAFLVVISLELGLLVACFCQDLFLNGHLPALDGNEIDWMQYDPSLSLGNALLWAILFLAPLGLCLLALKRDGIRFFLPAAAFIPVLVLVMQGASIGQMVATAPEKASTRPANYQISGEGEFTVSSESNVIVFVLDFFSNTYLDNVLQQNPTAVEALHDFTYYSNCSSTYVPTIPSFAHLLTGNEFDPNATQEAWFADSWQSERCQSFYSTLHERGYNVSIYAHAADIAYNVDNMIGCADNVTPTTQTIVHYDAIVTTLLQTTIYRIVPYCLKDAFWINYTQFDTLTTQLTDTSQPISSNSEYYNTLTSQGLTLSDDDGNGAFIVQYLEGVHPAWHTNSQCQEEEGVNTQQNTEGCLLLLSTYINELKRLGVYDNSTIIITSDHGTTTVEGTNQTDFGLLQPIFLIKEAGAQSDQLRTSSAPISHCEFQGTVLKNIGVSDTSAYGTTIYDWSDSSVRTRTVGFLSAPNLLIYEYTGDRTALSAEASSSVQVVPLADDSY